MGFDSIVVNGRVVTATDSYTADIAIDQGRISRHRPEPCLGPNAPQDH